MTKIKSTLSVLHLFFQLKECNYTFFPLNRAMCLEDEEDKYENMMKTLEANMEHLVLQVDNMVGVKNVWF